jgi:hypothetical protein
MSNKCNHNKRKSRCIECNGSEICQHIKIKYRCIECNGSDICQHNKRKSNCKECEGGSICEHNRIRSRCIECCGGSICEHSRRREQCKDCVGSSICKHIKLKYSEFENFKSYWTEPDKKGKQRWENEKYFDISRRIKTWMTNKTKFNNDKSTDKPRGTSIDRMEALRNW